MKDQTRRATNKDQGGVAFGGGSGAVAGAVSGCREGGGGDVCRKKLEVNDCKKDHNASNALNLLCRGQNSGSGGGAAEAVVRGDCGGGGAGDDAGRVDGGGDGGGSAGSEGGS